MAQVTQLSIIGNVCKQVKACAIRGTKNGQWAVLTACNGGKSLLDVAFFDGAKEADARELAKLLVAFSSWQAAQVSLMAVS